MFACAGIIIGVSKSIVGHLTDNRELTGIMSFVLSFQFSDKFYAKLI